MSDLEPIFTIQASDNTIEVYLLNPGEHFPGFGGSKQGLTVRKTASLIVRQTSPTGQQDVEFGVADPATWARLRRLIRKYGLVPGADDESE
jgi:hypothetical protein